MAMLNSGKEMICENITPTFSVQPYRYQCYKQGKIVHFSGYWQGLSGTCTITFPTGARPSVFADALSWSSANAMIRGGVDTDGKMTITGDGNNISTNFDFVI